MNELLEQIRAELQRVNAEHARLSARYRELDAELRGVNAQSEVTARHSRALTKALVELEA